MKSNFIFYLPVEFPAVSVFVKLMNVKEFCFHSYKSMQASIVATRILLFMHKFVKWLMELFFPFWPLAATSLSKPTIFTVFYITIITEV